ncbi:DUF551 domain-containing protein [Burkholderia gladioli]|uniref:DUF551 domain-containing protein n=1 Tax=Burkholderia gladioli TaxID=28095 RepID=UPI00163F2F91|nr:DUF551 domain-containing protein [Burkholderia gladioli]
MSDKLSACAECGMPCAHGEYHPHAACLMFNGCRDSSMVRAGLESIREHALAASPARAILESDVLRHRAVAAEARLEHTIKILTRIHGFLLPDAVRLPDGRVFEFSNPEIEHEMMRGLRDAIRAVPDEIAALEADTPPRAAAAVPTSSWPGYKRGFSDGQRAADRIHAQRVTPAADTEQLAEARKLIAHACEFAMVQLDDEWHERAAALLALPAPDISASAPPATRGAWVAKADALPPAPGWYLVMLEPDNDWGLMSDTPLQVEFDAFKSKPREFTCICDWRTDEVITSAVTHWMPMPAAPGDATLSQCGKGGKA